MAGDGIEARVGTLEARASAVEATVETEAQLRATMDFDMGKMQAEFRAQRSMLQALHVTQQDHNRRLTGVEGRRRSRRPLGDGVEDRLTGVEGRDGRWKAGETGVEGRLMNVEGKLDLVSAGIEAIHGKLDVLIDQS